MSGVVLALVVTRKVNAPVFPDAYVVASMVQVPAGRVRVIFELRPVPPSSSEVTTVPFLLFPCMRYKNVSSEDVKSIVTGVLCVKVKVQNFAYLPGLWVDAVFASKVLFTVLLKGIVGITGAGAGAGTSVVKVTVDESSDSPALLYALILQVYAVSAVSPVSA